jgi:hypothetical protein
VSRLGWHGGAGVVLDGEGGIIILGIRFVEGIRALADVMLCGVMFCIVVGAIAGSATPIDMELALSDLGADPVVPHIQSLGPALFDAVVRDATGSTIVGDERCGRLGVPKFFEGDPLGDSLFAVVE